MQLKQSRKVHCISTMIGKTMIGKTMIGKTEEEDRLVASPFLFRFAIPCLRHDSGWSKKGIQLTEKFTLPCFGLLDKTNPKSVQAWAEIRAAWNPAGIILNARVTGKRQPPWCRASRIEESDGIAVWINTRNTSQIHRASRFCHEFCFLPSGAGTKLNEPVAKQLAIQRAKENVAIHESSPPLIRSERRVDGYLLEAFIPADTLTGYNPDEHNQIGFHYVVNDREMGQHVITVGQPFPCDSDPSLWSTLELIDQ